MRVLRAIPELRDIPGPLVLAIGVFDGVHLGHREVISTAVRDARAAGGNAVVVTFDPHPAKVLRPEKATRLLTATQHKIALLRDLGATELLLINFNDTFAATPPAEFVRALAHHAQPLREICVGDEWSFGKNRAGNVTLLRALGDDLGFRVASVPSVTVNGETVSSTAIRRAVEAGDLARAARLLGREYTVLGTVTRGAQLGRQVGFPTANLSAHNEQFPPDGVYAVEARLSEGKHFGVANLGYRPTVTTGTVERLLEVHLFDFDQDIYERDLELRFIQHIRPEQKFESVEALAAQIAEDARIARAVCMQ